jgi:hypothetical protein
MVLPLALTLVAFPAPAEVSLLVCISSPIYLPWVSIGQRSTVFGGIGIRLQELVTALELLMFALDDFNAVDDFHEASLQSFGLLYQGLASIVAHLLNLFAAPARAHGARIAVVVLFLLFLHLDVGAVAGYYDGAARLSAPKTGPRLEGGVDGGHVLFAD